MEEIYSKELMPYFLEYLSKHSWSDNLNKWSDRKSNTFRIKYNNLFIISCIKHENDLFLRLEISS